MSAAKVGVRIISDSNENYFKLEDGALWLETKQNIWGSWLTEFNDLRLEKILGLSDPQPLITRKNTKKARTTIDATMSKINKFYGQDLTWIDNTQEIYETLKGAGRSENDLYKLGDVIITYVNQFNTELTKFCKDADNKEQLQNELTSGQVGLRISTDDKYFELEEGTLWLQTKQNIWGSWLTEFNTDKLEKILGLTDQVPLITKKNLKKANATITGVITKLSKVYGSDLIWVDNNQEIYEGLKSSGKSDNDLYKLGDVIVAYVNQFNTEFTKFLKDPDNKEQIQIELSSGQVGVRLTDKNDEYFALVDGALWLETKSNIWGSWLTEFNSDRIEKILGRGDPQPLITRKNVKKTRIAIDNTMNKVKAVFGAELSWAENTQELYETLKTAGKSENDLYKLGDQIVLYVNQFNTEIAKFCKDKDNKEALQEVLSAGQVGIRIVSSGPKKWIIEDGALWMETTTNVWGSWITEFNAPELEKIL
jgi:hypothetical protein